MAISISKVPIYGLSPKRWGRTISIAVSDRPTHTAYAEMKAGGYSSVHYHQYLYNRFFLIKGRLLIEVFRNGDIETIIMEPLQNVDIEPGIKHRMSAIEDCQLNEIYWHEDPLVLPNFEDIVRDEDGDYPLPSIGNENFSFDLDKTWELNYTTAIADHEFCNPLYEGIDRVMNEWSER